VTECAAKSVPFYYLLLMKSVLFVSIAVICLPGTLVADPGHQQSVTVHHQVIHDHTTVDQRFRASEVHYRYQFSERIGMDLEYQWLGGDLKGNFLRVGASGSLAFNEARFNYGLHHYEQRLDNNPSDPTDSGLKYTVGAGYRFGNLRFDLNYVSEDLEGANPDDPGDYVEMERAELILGFYPIEKPVALEYRYINSPGNYEGHAISIRLAF